MVILNQRDTIEHIARVITERGHAVLDRVPLHPRYFRGPETDLCFFWQEGNYYACVSSDARYTGGDGRVAAVFAAHDHRGWRQLLIPASPDLVTVLACTEVVLGLDGQPPRVSWMAASFENVRHQERAPDNRIRIHSVQDTDPADDAEPRRNRARFGEDLVALAEKGKLETPIGRAAIMDAILQILSKSKKSSCILLGEPGVGKTAIVEGLAVRIYEGNVPESMRDRRIYSLNMSYLAAELPHYSQLLTRIKEIVDEARRDERIILFFDEAHSLIDPKHDVSQALKADLGRHLRVIAATTNKEYHRFIALDEAFARRFQRIPVPELPPEQCLDVLRGVKGRYEKHHGVVIPDELLPWIIKVSVRYVKDRALPDKALDLLDEACARLKLTTKTSAPAPP